MKTLILILISVYSIFGQSTIEAGIVDSPLENYNVYAEIKTDTSASVLVEDLDILKTDISEYLITLENQTTSGDTLIGEFVANITESAYLKVAVVALDPMGVKRPSLMKATKWWTQISARMPKPLDIFIEEK